MKSKLALSIALSAAASSVSVRAADFIPLGDLPGGAFFSRAQAISADGTTVVGYSKASDVKGGGAVIAGDDQAFRWTLSGGMVGLGDLAGGTPVSRAYGVSGNGMVIVGGSNSSSGDEAFRWTSSGGMTGLGDLAGGGFFSQANAISNNGNIIVGQSESASGMEAFRYNFSIGVQGLGDLPGDSFRSNALAASDNGSVIVGGSDSSVSVDEISFGTPSGGSVSIGSYDEAFRWETGSGITGIGIDDYSDDFLGLSGGGSSARGISPDGEIVVGWTTHPDTIVEPTLSRAFRWTETDGFELLGPFQLGIANDLAADGEIVVGRYGTGTTLGPADSKLSAVGFTDTEPLLPGADEAEILALGPDALASEAFVWRSDVTDTTADLSLTNLQSVLENEYGLDLTGWTLQSATAISDDGRHIVGYGINPDGDTEGWIVRDFHIIPEPTSGALLLALAGFTAGLRRRRQA
ncbi:MAG: PEP-CTERM sorting domain-containing protein [Planctomycetota bacterium]